MPRRENHTYGSLEHSENFSRIVIEEADIVKPILREQLFKEYITGVLSSEEILDIYCKTFELDAGLKTRMLIIRPSGGFEREDLYFFRNMTEKALGEEHIAAVTIICRNIVVVTDITDDKEISSAADRVRSLIKACYRIDATAVYSAVSELSEVPEVYRGLVKCLGYSFYDTDKRTACAEDIEINTGAVNISPQYSRIERAVRSGNRSKAEGLIEVFFEELKAAAPMPGVAKTYCLELYVCIIRCCEAEKIEKYMKGITEIQNGLSLSQIREFIIKKADEIALSNAPKGARVYSELINKTISIIDNNISNENLSLRWLAGTILYTNVDYLGKLFKKETGDNFSHYVMTKRMELAKSLIMSGGKDRIYEIAERVGYGSNPQYFSQVFKRYTGVSPLEYKGFARAL